MPVRVTAYSLALLLIVLLSAGMHLLSYDFSLPYVDHLDEPNYYLAGLEWRGLYDNNGYYDNVPPGYIALHAALQPLLETVGVQGLAATVQVFRLLSVLLSLGTLVLVADTARRAAGPLAGCVAGLAWAFSPLILTNTVYALPNPYLYFLSALALWLALIAWQQPARVHWAVWSVIAGLVAVVIRYEAFPLLAPGFLVSLGHIGRDRRRGLRLLVLQTVLIVGTAAALIWGYGFDPGTLDREAAAIRDVGLQNFVDLERTLNNFYHVFVPLNPVAALLLIAAGLVLTRRRDTWLVIGLAFVVIAGTVFMTNTYSLVEPDRIRYVLPGTVMAAVLVGIGVQAIADRLPGRWSLLLIPLLAALYIPQAQQNIRIVQDRRLPESRVEVRQWFDVNVEPGTVLVGREHHKTFNPFWGGIPYVNWFDWWEVQDIRQYSPAEWIEQHGISYALVPLAQVDTMRETPEGGAYLDSLLHLRDFTPPPAQRGPRSAAFRLWGMQYALEARFGDNIRLLGYDLSSDNPAPGDTIELHFYWQADQQPQQDYSLFLHLSTPDSTDILAQADGTPARVERLTLTWTDPDETLISAPFVLAVPSDLPPGDYVLRVGLYDYRTGVRLPVSLAGSGAEAGDTLTLTTITAAGD